MSKEKENQKFRTLSGWHGAYTNTILACIPISGIIFLLHLSNFVGVSLYMQQYFGLVFGLITASAFLLVPMRRGKRNSRLPWYDFFCSILALIVGLYVAINYKAIAVDAGLIMPERVFLGCVAIILILEAARRVVGWAFVIIVLCFLFYALFSSYMPGILGMKSIPWDSLASYLYLDPQGIFGIPLKVSVTIVLVFILFGQMLTSIGGGEVFMDISFSLMGKYRGGPAKVAIVGSSLFGSISGSAVANVATTGVFTIPLMKKAGYTPEFAGAVEAVSSTGGQIVPPIMGAAAFLMATFLGLPYSTIAISALIPAVLYYLAVFIQVDLRAAKQGLTGLPPDQLPVLINVLKAGWIFLLPIIALIMLLFVFRLEPENSGLIATGIALATGFLFKHKTKLTFQKLIDILCKTGRTLLEVGITSAGAGIIIGVLSITGLGFIFSNLLVTLAHGNMFLLLIMAATGSIILGMGMTVTAAYLLMVVLIAPALVEVGISALIAHFFVFYFAVLSFLTPPVCLAGYAAASIAGAPMMKTAVQGMRLGIAAYIVPFIFAYHPALLLQGNFLDVTISILGAVIGISLVAVASEGYLFREFNWLERIFFATAGCLIMIPGIYTFILGIAIALPLIVMSWRGRVCSMSGKESAKQTGV